MARAFPYTYISCPCTDASTNIQATKRSSKDIDSGVDVNQQDGEDERTFDPRSPRSNFSLYPPEHLLYCEECHQIKCPRCITEEIVCWFCPSCLFETPSSMVRSEGNRCARNCFNCPICTAPTTVNTLENTEAGGSQQGPWILTCGYCMWTTLDIGIKFDKPTSIRAQLSKFRNGGLPKPSPADSTDPSRKSSLAQDPTLDPLPKGPKPSKDDLLDLEARFSALRSFYKSQLADSSSSANDPLLHPASLDYNSPSALNRIMNLYTGLGIYGHKNKSKTKPPLMREALSPQEGLTLSTSGSTSQATIQKMATEGWEGSTSISQRTSQPSSSPPRFVDDLRPQPTLLRTKRAKRCKACKHILVKPEFKPQSTRFRIRLIALSYVPLTTLKPLPMPASSTTTAPVVDLNTLQPLKPTQFLLTLKNHMFDPVKVTLATPTRTPGRFGSKVTILCPQFDVGANSDVWDDALNAPSSSDLKALGGEKVAEAGKVWEKGRNWTGVVVEAVPSLVEGEIEEDEDVLEIPVFVRLEWKGEGTDEDGKGLVERELAYWMVLGVGRIKTGEM